MQDQEIEYKMSNGLPVYVYLSGRYVPGYVVKKLSDGQGKTKRSRWMIRINDGLGKGSTRFLVRRSDRILDRKPSGLWLYL